jgi:hypothetical protein
MFERLNRFARPAFAAVALSLVAMAAPATAEQKYNEFIFEHDDYDDCHSVKQAVRFLKKRNYKMIEKLEKEAEEGIYLFSAKKKNQHHEFVAYYIAYDACDHEIVSRTPIKLDKV